MNINPIYEREHRVSTRSLRLSTAILVFNFIVAGFTLIEMNGVVDYARKTSSIDYTSFLQIFKIVVFVPVVLLIFVGPSFISGAISDERHRGTSHYQDDCKEHCCRKVFKLDGFNNDYFGVTAAY